MSEREATNSIDMGARKYREKIHKESALADSTKNLPFKFSKPRKDKPSRLRLECSGCGKEFAITEDTRVVICSGCKCINRVNRKKKDF